jgi:peptidoglycan-associated lipoprotein
MEVAMNMKFRVLHITVLPALALAIGCSSTAGPEPEAAATERPEPVAKTVSADERSELANALSAAYFATGSARLRAETRESLAKSADAIVAHPDWGRITVEGHCDERGSDAYNQALGARRAEAVVSFLVDRGVSASRLETRSYGSTRPAVEGHDESAWRFNRRSQFGIEAVDHIAGRSPASRSGLAANEDAQPRD